MQSVSLGNPSGVDVIYDGECPFCASFVKMVRLRETFGEVRLVNARHSADPTVADVRQRYKLDDGFVVIFGGREYYGPEALEFISIATADNAPSRLLMRTPLFRGRLGRMVYPLMVKGRKLALRLMGRKPMGY